MGTIVGALHFVRAHRVLNTYADDQFSYNCCPYHIIFLEVRIQSMHQTGMGMNITSFLFQCEMLTSQWYLFTICHTQHNRGPWTAYQAYMG